MVLDIAEHRVFRSLVEERASALMLHVGHPERGRAGAGVLHGTASRFGQCPCCRLEICLGRRDWSPWLDAGIAVGEITMGPVLLLDFNSRDKFGVGLKIAYVKEGFQLVKSDKGIGSIADSGAGDRYASTDGSSAKPASSCSAGIFIVVT